MGLSFIFTCVYAIKAFLYTQYFLKEKENAMRKTESVVEEKRFEYRGYPCVVLFMDMGHRCGYVGIPADKPLTFDPEDENRLPWWSYLLFYRIAFAG